MIIDNQIIEKSISLYEWQFILNTEQNDVYYPLSLKGYIHVDDSNESYVHVRTSPVIEINQRYIKTLSGKIYYLEYPYQGVEVLKYDNVNTLDTQILKNTNTL
jgi:hypothetical protein